MVDNDDRAERLRDLGDAREPVAGTADLGKVGDVGDLPYAVDEEGDGDTGALDPRLLVGLVVALIVVIGVVVALVA